MSTHCLSGRNLLCCGVQCGFREIDGKLNIRPDKASAVYVSQIYDSGREGTEWNHILLDVGRDAVLEVYVWLFDRIDKEKEAYLRKNIRCWFREQKGSAQYHSNYRNMLLYGNGSGRYARLAVKILQGRGKNVLFGGYDLSFPKESFAEYLPAVYRNNLQLDRFLAVHQNLYLGLEKAIDALAEKLDHELCTKSQAVRLAQWLGWGELAEQVEEDTLRELLRNGVSLTAKKGTCDYYIQMTEILTGEEAFIIEEPEKGKAVVLIRNRPEDGRERFLEWLRKNTPIGMEIDFVILHRTDRLDNQCFLDRTSFLSEYESILAAGGCPVECLKLL